MIFSLLAHNDAYYVFYKFGIIRQSTTTSPRYESQWIDDHVALPLEDNHEDQQELPQEAEA